MAEDAGGKTTEGWSEYLDLSVCVWGDVNVGKYCLVDRFLNRTWNPRSTYQSGVTTFRCRSIALDVMIDLDIHVIPSQTLPNDPELAPLMSKCVGNAFCYAINNKPSLALLEKV